MLYSDIPSAQIAVQTARQMGITRVVISPGSRNAPLIISFTSDPHFTCYSIVDERSAGFFALGMARELGEPVIMVCTSGSALLNYYPAVAEAYYSCIPLIVLSADRPPYKIDIGDGQTIRQQGVFEKHCDTNLQLSLDLIHAPEEQYRSVGKPMPQEEVLLREQARIQQENLTAIQKAYSAAFQSYTPVHVNIPFEEPLYGKTEDWMAYELQWQAERQREISNGVLDIFQGLWNSSGRKMILIGAADPDMLTADICREWSQDPSVLVFTETTSNVHHSSFFPSIDSIIAPLEKSADNDGLFRRLQPELLVTMGGMIVSKKVKAFLRKYAPKTHYHFGREPARATFFIDPVWIAANPAQIFEQIPSKETVNSADYQAFWRPVKMQYKALRSAYLKDIPHSDFLVFDEVIRNLPEDAAVHFANSSAIRYAQLFEMDPSHRVSCNRGTSGIEGSTSTAVGAAAVYEGTTILISGDLGFLYDSNAFWNEYVPRNFRVIVINNQGGGIFRILPGKEDTETFSRYFETTHERDSRAVCETYGMAYHRAESAADLATAWDDFYREDDQVKLLEIFTPREINDQILLKYFDFLSSKTTYNPILTETPDGEQKR